MRLIRSFIDFAENSSLHGIKYTVDSAASVLERIFWILIILLSLSCSAYFTVLFWSRYKSNFTRTVVETTTAPITTVPFPGITICNINKILDGKVEAFLGTLDADYDQVMATKAAISKLLNNEMISNNSPIKHNMTELSIAEEVLTKNGFADIKRILKRISQSCDEMIVECAWNKKQKRCGDIFHETFTSLGKCCSFNYVKQDPLQTSYYGFSTGLRITLVPAYNSRSTAGVTITIHNPKEFPSGDNTKRTLPLGHVNHMQIKGLKQSCSRSFKDLHPHHRKCIYSDERDLDYFDAYSYSNCLSSCEARAVIEHCRCVPYYYEFIYEERVCSYKDFTCLGNITDDIDKNCDCPLQCEDELYEVMLTTTQFTNKSDAWMADYFKGINDTASSILLDIFFPTNKQTIWSRDTITSGIYLISSFGGIYSLFLGCSIITVVEILYYFLVKNFVENVCTAKKIVEQKEAKVIKVFTFQNIGISTKFNQSHPIVPYID